MGKVLVDGREPVCFTVCVFIMQTTFKNMPPAFSGCGADVECIAEHNVRAVRVKIRAALLFVQPAVIRE